ncbi:hypothetical protein BDV11DRAFT_171522 [Aspergillus similis]
MGIHITPTPEPYATAEVSVPQEADLVPLGGRLGVLEGILFAVGSFEMLPGLLKTVERAFSAIPGAQIEWREFPGTSGQVVTAAETKGEEIPHSGIPTLVLLGILNSRSDMGGGHIDYSPVIPPSGS